MFQEPAAQTVSPLTGLAMGIGSAVAKAAVMALSILIAAPALASMALLWAGQRWPSLGNSVIANGIGGIVLTIAFSWLVVTAMGLIGGIVDLGGLASLMPLISLALMALMFVLQWRARATVSRARVVGVVCALLTPIAWMLVYNATN